MAQNTFNGSGTHGDARAVWNGNATDAETRLATLASDVATKAEYSASVISGTSGTLTAPSTPGIAAYVLTNSGARNFSLPNPDSVVEGAKIKVQNGQDPGGNITITVAAGTGSTDIDFGTQVVLSTTAATIEFLKLNNKWWSR